MAQFLFWLLILTVAWAPLPLASDRPGPSALLALLVGAQLVLFAIGAIFSRDLIEIPWRRYYWAMLGFVVLAIWFIVQQSTATPVGWHDPIWTDASKILGTPLQGTMTLDPDAARQTIMRMITYAGVFFLAMQLCRARARANLALWSLVLAGVGYSIYGLWATFHGGGTILWFDKYGYRDSVSSTFFNRNNFGTYAGMMLIATLGLLFTQLEESLRFGFFSRAGFVHFMDSVNFRVFLLVGFAVLIASALLLTSSRGAAMSTAVGVVAFALADRVARRHTTGPGRLRVTLIALAGLGVLMVVFSGNKLVGRISSNVSSIGREYIYSITLHAIAAHPWIGTGLGSFGEAFSRYRDARLDSADYIFDLAHNTYLELTLEMGVPAMALLLAILAGIVLVTARGLVLRRRDFVFSTVALGITALVALHSTVDFSLQMPAVAVAYALILGVAFAQAHPTQEREAESGNRRPARA